MHVWANCGDRTVSLQHVLMEAVSGHMSRQPGWAVLSCRVLGRIETFNLHLSRIIASERSTRAFTCINVASRIAGSPNPVSRTPTITIVAFEVVQYLMELVQPLSQDSIRPVSLQSCDSRGR